MYLTFLGGTMRNAPWFVTAEQLRGNKKDNSNSVRATLKPRDSPPLPPQVSIGAGDTFVVPLDADPGCLVCWDFSVAANDIGFSVIFTAEGKGAEVEMLAPARVDGHKVRARGGGC
jgi:hypothetical protein